MMNNGRDKGFVVCQDCGAAVPAIHLDSLKKMTRPYLLPFSSKPCPHTDTMEVNIGYDFITDMLVLECALDSRKLDTCRKSPWLERAA